jgi:hypothetical protein
MLAHEIPNYSCFTKMYEICVDYNMNGECCKMEHFLPEKNTVIQYDEIHSCSVHDSIQSIIFFTVNKNTITTIVLDQFSSNYKIIVILYCRMNQGPEKDYVL